MSELSNMNLFGKATSSAGVLPFRVFQQSEVYSISVGNTSRGNQKKYKSVDGSYYIKSRFIHQQHLWKDHLVEVIASRYAHLCSLPSDTRVVKQGLCKLGVDDCSYSEAFDLAGYAYVPFGRALGDKFNAMANESRSTDGLSSWFSTICDFYSDIVGSDQTKHLLAMMLLDVVVANEDRHLSNFGYLTPAGIGDIEVAPLFDFGLGLFEHDTNYYPTMPLERAIKRIQIKPWGVKVHKILEFLDGHSDFVSAVLPQYIQLGDFDFPSKLAHDYFRWVNERLGVKVVDM